MLLYSPYGVHHALMKWWLCLWVKKLHPQVVSSSHLLVCGYTCVCQASYSASSSRWCPLSFLCWFTRWLSQRPIRRVEAPALRAAFCEGHLSGAPTEELSDSFSLQPLSSSKQPSVSSPFQLPSPLQPFPLSSISKYLQFVKRFMCERP